MSKIPLRVASSGAGRCSFKVASCVSFPCPKIVTRFVAATASGKSNSLRFVFRFVSGVQKILPEKYLLISSHLFIIFLKQMPQCQCSANLMKHIFQRAYLVTSRVIPKKNGFSFDRCIIMSHSPFETVIKCTAKNCVFSPEKGSLSQHRYLIFPYAVITIK